MTFPWQHYQDMREEVLMRRVQDMIDANSGMSREEIENIVRKSMPPIAIPEAAPIVIEPEPEPDPEPPVVVVVIDPEPDPNPDPDPEPDPDPAPDPDPDPEPDPDPDPEPVHPHPHPPKRNNNWWHKPVTFGK